MAKQKRLCPWCGRPLRINGMELSADGAYEVCDNDECGYSMTLVAPDWARMDGKPEKHAKPQTPKPRPPHLRLVD